MIAIVFSYMLMTVLQLVVDLGGGARGHSPPSLQPQGIQKLNVLYL